MTEAQYIGTIVGILLVAVGCTKHGADGIAIFGLILIFTSLGHC